MTTTIERIRARSEEFALRIPLYIVVLFGAVVFGIPLIWMIRTAVMPSWQILLMPPQWIPAEIHLENFATLFERRLKFHMYLKNTILVTGFRMLGILLSSSMAAFSLSRLRYKGRDMTFKVILATMMLPAQVTLVPRYYIFSRLGWLDTLGPLIVPHWLGSAYHIFLLRQFFMTIPNEMDDAAKIDGCGFLGLYWRIVLPMSLPALGVVAISVFTWSWNDFFTPLLYITRRDQYTLALALQLLKSQMATDWGVLMAGSLFTLAPVLTLFFFAQRYFIQGVVITGVKG